MLLATAAAVTLTAGAATAGTPAGTPTARTFNGVPTVGALFLSATPTAHFCTASVIKSPRGNILMTAAHCIEGNAKGLMFVPDYHDGVAPFGRWTVTGVYLNPQWRVRQNTQRDYAFLTVAPRRIDGALTNMQQLTGANVLGSAATAGESVTVPGYPDGRQLPITCVSHVYFDGIYPAFNCTPYPGGMSGSPWLKTTSHGDEVVGLIAGLHQGGCQVYTSYSPPLGVPAAETLARAVTGTHPERAPQSRSDGC